MEKRGVLYLFLGCLAFGFIYCGGRASQAPSEKKEVTTAPSKPQASQALPEFMKNRPRQDGFVYGTGEAQHSSAEIAKDMADGRARKDAALAFGQKIGAILKQFMEKEGVGTKIEIAEFVHSIVKSFGEMELPGCEIEQRDYIKGSTYSLAKFRIDKQAHTMVIDIVKQNLASRKSLQDGFTAKKGFDILDLELQRLESTP